MAVIEKIGTDGWFVHEYMLGRSISFKEGSHYVALKVLAPEKYTGHRIVVAIQEVSDLELNGDKLNVGDRISFDAKRIVFVDDGFRIGISDNLRSLRVLKKQTDGVDRATEAGGCN